MQKESLIKQITHRQFSREPQKCLLSLSDVSLEVSFVSEEAHAYFFANYPLVCLEQGVTPRFKVKWFDSRDLGWGDNEWQCLSANTEVIFVDEKISMVCHRDFIATIQGESISLLTPHSQSYGFLQFLLWLMPSLWGEQDKLAIQGLSLLGPDRRAYLCMSSKPSLLSAMTQSMPKSKILGEGVQILKLEGKMCSVQTVGWGHKLGAIEVCTDWYNVGGFFYIEEVEGFSINSISREKLMELLYQSVHHSLQKSIGNQFPDLIKKISMAQAGYKLGFEPNLDSWAQIFLNQNFC